MSRDPTGWPTKMLDVIAQEAGKSAYRASECETRAHRALVVMARQDPLLMTALVFRGASAIIRAEAKQDRKAE